VSGFLAKEVSVLTRRVKPLACVFLMTGAGALILAPAAGADWMGEFFPLHFGSTWTYQNRDIPGDIYTESVFEIIEYEGHSAVRVGIDADNHTIARREGLTITILAEVEDGLLFDLEENIVLGEFEDGYIFRTCAEVPCESLLVRVWDNLDPVLRGIYGVDPAPGELILVASYDPEYPPNFHSAIVASNLPGGVTPPTGAIMYLEWYRRDVGEHGMMEVDPVSGEMFDEFFLVNYSVSVPEPEAVLQWPALDQNFPNPFTRATTVRCQVPVAAGGSMSNPAGLRIYDSLGRIVRSLGPSGSGNAGSYAYVWDGRDQGGRSAPAGTYFYRLESGASSEAQRMLLLR
jgi:hypothetical protein